MSVRLDRWLVASRAYKTRSIAQDHCKGGHVKVNDLLGESSTPVKVGDTIGFWRAERRNLWRISALEVKRASAEQAMLLYADLTPREADVVPVETRDRGAGRPTKRDGREIRRLKTGADDEPES